MFTVIHFFVLAMIFRFDYLVIVESTIFTFHSFLNMYVLSTSALYNFVSLVFAIC